MTAVSRVAGKTLLLGYVGKGNLGDDLMVEAVAARLPEGSWEVVGGRTPVSKLVGKLLGARRIIVCGGCVVTPRTGSYQRVLMLARLLRVRRLFYSIEISGWPKGRRGRFQRLVMKGADISARTFESSAICLKHMPTAEIVNVLDLFLLHPAFAELPQEGKTAQFGRFTFTAGSGQRRAIGRIVVLPRSFSESAPYSQTLNVQRIVSEVSRVSQTAGTREVLVSPSANIDEVSAYASALAGKGYDLTVADKDAELFLSPEDHVVTNRLHIGKSCAFYGVPHTLVSYDRKTELPELIGSIGEILQTSGARVPIQRIALRREEFCLRRRLSLSILDKSLAR